MTKIKEMAECVEKLLEEEPTYVDNYFGNTSTVCVYCMYTDWPEDKHEDSCPWLRLKTLMGKTDADMQDMPQEAGDSSGGSDAEQAYVPNPCMLAMPGQG